MSIFIHNTTSKLLYSQDTSLLTDFSLTLNDVLVLCHKAIISQQSSRLSSLIQKDLSEFAIDVWEEASPNELKLFVEVLYGQSCTFTPQNSVSLFLLSKTLGCDEIATLSYYVLNSTNSCKYFIPVERILENLKVDEFKDHEIIFHDFSLKIHKFFFASISPYFKAKFTKQWQDSNDTTSVFSKLLQVSPSSFSNFFTSFYDGKLEVNVENAFEYTHLAWYFQLAELEKFVENFILNSKAEYQWVTSLVLKAINCEDYRFIKIISTKISEIPDLSSCDPIPVHPLFFQNLTPNIDVSWLLRCLPSTKSIKLLSLCSQCLIFLTFYHHSLYLSIFSKFTSQVPLNWFTWFIVESDLRREFNLISQVSPLLNEIITPENINQVPIPSFNSETLCLFAINSKQGTSIYWSLVCLIELWSRSQINVEEFSTTLMGFDLSETGFELVYSALGKLFTDETLKPILFEFVSVKLVPRLVEENKKTVAEKDNVITKLEAENNHLTQQLTEHETIICHLQKEVEERKLVEERRITEEEQKRRTAEHVRIRPKYLASDKGSNITLSENDLVATKNVDGYDNSFVAIQHPVKGKVVLTLLNFGFDLETCIGFFDPSYSQIDGCYDNAHFLHVHIGIQFFANIPNQSGPSISGRIPIGQQIIIEFNNNQATFSVRSLGYSHIVTWPSDYVFGLTMLNRNTSWKLSNS
ncbi:hypothetical protein RCL1_008137 [Eukaryota sp. TZLM3-RCL]